MFPKILLVEDYIEIQLNFKEAFEHTDFDVEIQCADGQEEVLDIINSGWIPDVVLIDHHLKGTVKGSAIADMFDVTFPEVKLISVSAMRQVGYPKRTEHISKMYITNRDFLKALVRWAQNETKTLEWSRFT